MNQEVGCEVTIAHVITKTNKANFICNAKPISKLFKTACVLVTHNHKFDRALCRQKLHRMQQWFQTFEPIIHPNKQCQAIRWINIPLLTPFDSALEPVGFLKTIGIHRNTNKTKIIGRDLIIFLEVITHHFTNANHDRFFHSEVLQSFKHQKRLMGKIECFEEFNNLANRRVLIL